MPPITPEERAPPTEVFRHLVDLMHDCGFAHLDPEGRILSWSFGAERLLGYTPAEVLGRPLATLRHPGALSASMPPSRDSLNPRSPRDERMVCKDGTSLWVELTISPLDPQSELGGYAALIRDVSARKRSQEALRASDVRYRSVIDHVNDALFLYGPRGIVVDVNKQACECLGYLRSELIGMAASEFDSDLSPAILAGIDKRLASGETVATESQYRRRDGSMFVVEVRMRSFTMSAERHTVSLARDITERRNTQHAQKMEAIGQLAGGIAHDFNNLLTVINGYADLLLTELDPGDIRRDQVTEVRGAGERAAGLTRQLLAFSRKQILEPRVLDLNAVIAHSEKMFRRLIGEDITVTTVFGANLTPLRADPGQVEQVILNLVVNARDAMPSGGLLTIETSNATFGASGQYVQLSVSDTGCGMSEDVKVRIFEPFFTTKGVGSGTGLGLATVHGIVKQSGGHIRVDSHEGVGTTFKILLPAAPDKPLSIRPPGVQQMKSRGTETILLVEDEDAVRGIVRIALQMYGYKVLAANGAQAAEEAVLGYPGPIDLLITDVVMPKTSGRQVADGLRARNPGLKVLFVSGYTDDAVVRHGVLEATDHFLQKPFTPQVLANKVREVLDAEPEA